MSKFFTKTHEWIEAVHTDEYKVGITNHAQSELSDVVFVDLPKVGTTLIKGRPFMVIESVKAASDIYAPLDGEVVAVNEVLGDNPELVNTSAENEGWLVQVKGTAEQQSQLQSGALLSNEEYQKLLAS